MKSKKILALALLAAVGFGGIKAYANISESTISKNKLMTEKVVEQVNDKNNKEDKLKEIVLNELEKYFNQKIDIKNLKEEVHVVKADVEWNSRGKDYYSISWENEEKVYKASIDEDGKIFNIGVVYNNPQKVNLKLNEVVHSAFEKYFNEKIDIKNLKEEIQVVKADVEWNSRGKDYYSISWQNEEKTYYANIEEDGLIFDIGTIYNNSEEVDLIDLEEAKGIALDFIKENKLVDDVEGVEFLGEATISAETCGIVFKYGEDKGILVSVDSAKKEVKHFSLKTADDAKKCVENTDYRDSGIVG